MKKYILPTTDVMPLYAELSLCAVSGGSTDLTPTPSPDNDPSGSTL